MAPLEPVYTLAQAAEIVGVTADDVADPARWVRDQARKHKLLIVKAGRTPKLPLRSIEALRELITCRFISGEEAMDDPAIGTFAGPLPNGETGPCARSPSSRRALARLAEMRRKPSSPKSQPDISAGTSKAEKRRLYSVT